MCYVRMWEASLWSTNWNMGWEIIAAEERTQQTNDKHDYEPGFLRKTKTIDGKLKRQVVRLAPRFYEKIFRERNRAGNVGASQLQDQKLKIEHD